MNWRADLGTDLSGAWHDCRLRWRPLLAAGVACRIATAVLLPAAFAGLMRLALAGSGQAVLTDLDLLYFVQSPVGLLGLLILGAATVAVVAIEIGVLLTILCQPPAVASVADALDGTLARGSRFFRVAMRLVVATLVWMAPAALLAAATYTALLSEFDINYYLAERPPAFWAAAAIAVAIGGYVAIVGLKLATDWFLALPITLLEEMEPRQVRSLSQQRTVEDRWLLRGWITLWAASTVLLSSTATLAVGLVAKLIAPLWPHSLTATAAGVGLGLIALLAVSLAVNLVSSIAFAAMLRRLYLRFGGVEPDSALRHQQHAERRVPWLTTSRVAVGGALVTLAAATLGFVAIGGVSLEDDVLVIGHRGSPRSAPGNTLASIHAAIDDGADWVEIDVQETADGEVVVFHDSDFMKAAGIDLKTWDATRDRLDSIDLGSRFGPEFAGEGVPTFAAVLEACHDRVGVVVELKYYGHDVALEERVIEIVEQAGMIDQTKFMSLHRPGVEKFRSLRPKWETGVLLSVAVGGTKRLDADFLAINAKFASRKLLRASHRDGRAVYAWTVNDPVAMSALISRGVDGLITDLPADAKRVLAERATMTPVARLLIDLADRFPALARSPARPNPIEP